MLWGAFVGLSVSLSLVLSALLMTGTWGGGGPGAVQAFDVGPIATPTADVPTPRPIVESEPLEPDPTFESTAEGGSEGAPEAKPTATDTPVVTITIDAAPKSAQIPVQPPVAPPTSIPQQPAPTATPAPPTPTEPPAPPPASCPTAPLVGYASDLHSAINSERSAAGLPTLAAEGCAIYVAQLRSDDMASAGYFSHTSPSGETAFSLLDDLGVPHGWSGENLARNNYPDNESVGVAIRDLMASDGHRANILNTNYTSIGVAVAFDGEGMKYFTMVFMGPP